jgi:4-hydroxybutyrate CoA-transferase
MADVHQQYADKLISQKELVDRFRPGQLISFGAWYGEPYGVIKAIEEHGQHLENLSVSSSIATCPSAYMQMPRHNVYSGFLGPQERAAESTHRNVQYTPLNYCDGIRFMEHGRPIDYYVYRMGAMDDAGMFNCSMTASWEYRTLPWIKANRPDTKIVFEINSKLPYVHGVAEHGNNVLSIELADFIVEDDSDLLDYPVPAANPVEQRIAENVAELVPDRATVQLGFGTLPMAIGDILCHRKELGIHTEMFCEAHIDLVEAGAVTNAHKGLYDGISVATFALGTPRLHKWMTDNKDVAILPVEETNRADVLAKVKNLVSINSVLGVDRTGQTMAHCLGANTYSGLGGAFEFAFGAQLSPGGKSIVCLPSTTTLKDGTVISNITAQFPAGTRITVPEHITEWVVTEYGAVQLKFLPVEERAKALLHIAHPNFREQLERDMHEAGVGFGKLDRVPELPTGAIRPRTH